MIVFKNVTPTPLVGVTSLSSQVWNTSLVLEQGKNYLVSAASGKGKSTFTSIIYGLRHDYTGKVTLNDSDLQQQNMDWWATLRREKLAVVFQDLRLFLNFSAAENIAVKGNLTPNQTDMQRVSQMAEQLGVAHLLTKQVAHLSYGERQRIAIIRALTQPFEWLLLDEPFSHLDDANVNIAVQLIQEECTKRNAGWILASLGSDYRMPYQELLLL